MAFKTGSVAFVYDEVCRTAAEIKDACARTATAMAAANTPATTVFDLLIRAKQTIARFNTLKSTPGLAEYAKAQNDDPTYEVGAEFAAMLVALTLLASQIESDFPKDGNGFLLAQTFGASGPVDRAFTPAQTAAIRNRLNAVVASIA